jgi:hypothetical protein
VAYESLPVHPSHGLWSCLFFTIAVLCGQPLQSTLDPPGKFGHDPVSKRESPQPFLAKKMKGGHLTFPPMVLGQHLSPATWYQLKISLEPIRKQP